MGAADRRAAPGLPTAQTSGLGHCWMHPWGARVLALARGTSGGWAPSLLLGPSACRPAPDPRLHHSATTLPHPPLCPAGAGYVGECPNGGRRCQALPPLAPCARRLCWWIGGPCCRAAQPQCRCSAQASGLAGQPPGRTPALLLLLLTLPLIPPCPSPPTVRPVLHFRRAHDGHGEPRRRRCTVPALDLHAGLSGGSSSAPSPAFGPNRCTVIMCPATPPPLRRSPSSARRLRWWWWTSTRCASRPGTATSCPSTSPALTPWSRPRAAATCSSPPTSTSTWRRPTLCLSGAAGACQEG